MRRRRRRRDTSERGRGRAISLLAQGEDGSCACACAAAADDADAPSAAAGEEGGGRQAGEQKIKPGYCIAYKRKERNRGQGELEDQADTTIIIIK
jgi:hypothetical protein